MLKLSLHKTRLTLFALLLLIPLGLLGQDEQNLQEANGPSSAIVQRFVTAQQDNEDALRGSSMKVAIDANVPGIKEHGRLTALRLVSKVGQVSYHMLGFEGDNSVKKDVIARYLQAEQQGQGDQSLAIVPANYKFKYRGMNNAPSGRQAYVFQITPRKKKVGLWKGQLWLDSQTYLPVMEKGRWVKNPSIFVKKVDFEREFTIQNGIPIPKHIASTMDVRLVGKVELSVEYSDYNPHGAEETAEQSQSASVAGAAAR